MGDMDGLVNGEGASAGSATLLQTGDQGGVVKFGWIKGVLVRHRQLPHGTLTIHQNTHVPLARRALDNAGANLNPLTQINPTYWPPYAPARSLARLPARPAHFTAYSVNFPPTQLSMYSLTDPPTYSPTLLA